MHASESNKAAKELKAIAEQRNLSGQSAVTDKNGKVYFSNLDPGMYLVTQASSLCQGESYLMDPYLISVPLGETGDGENEWQYAVESIPKTELERETESETQDETETESEAETENTSAGSSGGGSSSGTSGSSVKTGDETNIGLYVMLCAGALVVIFVLTGKKYRKRI